MHYLTCTVTFTSSDAVALLLSVTVKRKTYTPGTRFSRRVLALAGETSLYVRGPLIYCHLKDLIKPSGSVELLPFKLVHLLDVTTSEPARAIGGLFTDGGGTEPGGTYLGVVANTDLSLLCHS